MEKVDKRHKAYSLNHRAENAARREIQSTQPVTEIRPKSKLTRFKEN